MAPSVLPHFKQSSRARGNRTHGDAATRLRQAILDGLFQPNERLIEEDLAEQFKTKRPAIRAALALLEQERLIVHERNKGARVRLVTPEEADEILECRAVLEALAARKAARRIDESGVARLRAIIAEMERHESAPNLRAYSECNGRFHQAISEVANHPTSARLLVLLKSQSVRYQYRSVLNPGRPTKSLREHKAIFQALSRHDPDAAEAAMRSHIDNVRDAVRDGAANLLP
ncbi:MAG TPA: GntR family transcriptional regulator [Candidatus Acidoferrales bacterium]|nr:GntR family transcriptional regulator [Candidatus Acidoferrales bacterium]